MIRLNETIEELDDVSLFADFLFKTKAKNLLEKKGPYTIFLPTNEATKITLSFLRSLELDALQEVVMSHIVIGFYRLNDLKKIDEVENIRNSHLLISYNEHIYIGGVAITDGDFISENGICHFINAVMIPS